MRENSRPKYDDVTPWVAEVLSHERLFGDAEPTWANSETSQQTVDRRRQIVRFLKKHGAADPYTPTLLEQAYDAIAERLESCEPGFRCLSGACPECNRALQRYFVSECETLLKTEFPSDEKVAVSLVFEQWEYLNAGSLEALQRKAKYLLGNVGVHFAFGGIDLSFNQVGREAIALWVPHFWLIVPTSDRSSWEPRLRQLNPATDEIIRPTLIRPYDGNLAGIAYALKTDFQRRVNYTQAKWFNGERRICSNTSHQPLRVAERLELYPFLDRVGLSARVFLLGARPTRTEHGISIVKLGGKARISESSETPS